MNKEQIKIKKEITSIKNELELVIEQAKQKTESIQQLVLLKNELRIALEQAKQKTESIRAHLK